MHPRALWASGDVSLRCRWRIPSYSPWHCLLQTRLNSNVAPKLLGTQSQRAFHTSTPVRPHHTSSPFSIDTLQYSQSLVTPTPIDATVDPVFIARPPGLPVRDHLVKWQVQYGGPSEETLSAFEKHPANGEIFNRISKVSGASSADDQTEGDRWFAGEDDDGEDLITIGLFLKPGDVVELS